jgi:putative SOS response-associated peptidase YedK
LRRPILPHSEDLPDFDARPGAPSRYESRGQHQGGFANINAKAEGIDTRPAFHEALQRRRCPVPVDNFDE